MKNFNLKGVTPATWVRIVSLFAVLVNQISISIFEFQLIPFTDDEIYEGLSTLATFVVAVIAAWKNNSISEPAQKADKVLKTEVKK